MGRESLPPKRGKPVAVGGATKDRDKQQAAGDLAFRSSGVEIPGSCLPGWGASHHIIQARTGNNE